MNEGSKKIKLNGPLFDSISLIGDVAQDAVNKEEDTVWGVAVNIMTELIGNNQWVNAEIERSMLTGLADLFGIPVEE